MQRGDHRIQHRVDALRQCLEEALKLLCVDPLGQLAHCGGVDESVHLDLGVFLGRDIDPLGHVTQVLALVGHDRCCAHIERQQAQLDFRAIGQIRRVVQEPALVRGILVVHVDLGSDECVY